MISFDLREAAERKLAPLWAAFCTVPLIFGKERQQTGYLLVADQTLVLDGGCHPRRQHHAECRIGGHGRAAQDMLSQSIGPAARPAVSTEHERLEGQHQRLTRGSPRTTAASKRISTRTPPADG
jgi:hypothetical protein